MTTSCRSQDAKTMAEPVSLSHWGMHQIDLPDAVFERDMAARKRRHDDGDRGAALEALYFCLSLRKPVPDWVSRPFCHAYGQVIGARAASWDSVFGKPRGHIKRRRRLMDLEFDAWILVHQLH